MQNKFIIGGGLLIVATLVLIYTNSTGSNSDFEPRDTNQTITASAAVESEPAINRTETLPETDPNEKTYIEIIDACNYSFQGDCLNVRSGPGTEYPVVDRFRTNMVVEVSEIVPGENNDWYKIVYDQKLYYPGRVKTEQYVAANFATDFVKQKPTTSWEDGAVDNNKEIVIDISDQKLYAYNADGSLFLETAVSTGEEFSPTTIGEHKVFKRMPSRYMQGPIPGSGLSDEYDLPGVPWNLYYTSDGEVIHGAYWHNEFGSRESHGCVNLRPKVAKKLYDWTPLGTKVTVRA